MDDRSIVVIRCTQSDCGKAFKMKRPERGGVYNVTCPYCKKVMRVNFPAPDAGNTNARKQEEIPELPDNSSKQPLDAEGEFWVGKTYSIVCPHCKKVKIGYTPKKEGAKGFECPCCHGKIVVTAKEVEPLMGSFLTGTAYDLTCPHCNATIENYRPSKVGMEALECPECHERIVLEVRKPTNVLRGSMDDSKNWLKGKLQLIRKWGFNKEYPLPVGNTVIGRYDELQMSDISVKNDPTMSRRSVVIEVSLTENGYMFKLKVLKAANPVLHNNAPLMAGEEVSLNFGDSIVLGQTRFCFVKDNGK